MSKQVEVLTLPECDFCNDGTLAEYDAKTMLGPWAYMCKAHYLIMKVGTLGTGSGQRLVVMEKQS